ncbi:hypothetical protein BGZ63DRAFT_147647 [Mariannaea sp. PMI_226]|nr:hypothetical protein BGZ63DRAFT_147647 [Mariannaea sp. PMI_226]
MLNEDIEARESFSPSIASVRKRVGHFLRSSLISPRRRRLRTSAHFRRPNPSLSYYIINLQEASRFNILVPRRYSCTATIPKQTRSRSHFQTSRPHHSRKPGTGCEPANVRPLQCNSPVPPLPSTTCLRVIHCLATWFDNSLSGWASICTRPSSSEWADLTSPKKNQG